MIPLESILAAIKKYIRITNGHFILSKNIPDYSSASEIPPQKFLIPFIENADHSWPFDIEPTPRILGNLIELLRACRFEELPTGEIVITADRDRAKNLGAFDTPEPVVRYIVETVLTPLCENNEPPRIIDPASGAGYFLLDAVDFLVRKFPRLNPEIIAEKSLIGFDIDSVAIALARRNLRWHFRNNYQSEIDDRTLDQVLYHIDALSEFENLPIENKSADGVIGNPPYQFFSGKGSPVALLRKTGKIEEARDLEIEIEKLASRFPDTSHGCRDRYKWFINRAVELLRPGGILGFITPNTWIAYPRYRDVRKLLTENGHFEAVIDLGTLAFKRAHVPAAIMIWHAASIPSQKIAFPFARISTDAWQSALDGDHSAISNSVSSAPMFAIDQSCDFHGLKNAPAESTINNELITYLLNPAPSRYLSTLGEIAVIREGSHAIRAVQRDIPRKQSARANYPALIDKTMGSLIPPELGYIPAPEPLPTALKNHTGQRFLIRKTGDRLIAAPSPTDEFALAHQNVYVGKLKTISIPFLTLVGILSSRLITDLYRAGPGGQHHRLYAQFRILFLNRLPIISLPKESQSEMNPKDKETARKIGMLHDEIRLATAELINAKNEKDRQRLDNLVYQLYGLLSKNE